MIYRNEKGSIEMASDQLRHKDINTTRRYYIQEDKQAKYDVIDTI
jgi:integrase